MHRSLNPLLHLEYRYRSSSLVECQKILGLKAKAPAFKVAFDLPNAARTSNTVDRLMNDQDRLLAAMQYFHGSLASANQVVRAMALLWNLHPYCTKVRSRLPIPGRRFRISMAFAITIIGYEIS